MPSDEFGGKVAIVTGSASGIGRSILTAFAERGAKCVIADMDTEWGPQVADDLRKSGRIAIFVPTDVSNSTHVARLFDEAASTLGGVDIVVNAAGIRVRNEVVDLSEED